MRDGRTRRKAVRRRRVLLTALALTAAAVSAAIGGGASWALWFDTVTNPSLQVATSPKVGIALGRVGGTATAATGAVSVLTVTLSRADAQTMLAAAPKAVAIPLAVRMRADGHAGITYSIAAPTFAASTLFGSSTVRLFPVTATTDAAATAACTVAAAPAVQPTTSNIVGIAAGVHPTAPNGLAVNYWCLTAVYSGTGGTYSNTATATGTAPSGVQTQGQSTWRAFVVAPGTFSLTHQLRLPGGQ